MTNSDWIELFRVIPEVEHSKLVVVLQNGTEFSVDTLCKLEPNYLVLRGRMGGTIEESRGVFIPYSKMLCLRIERIVKVEEMIAMCGAAAEAAQAEAAAAVLVAEAAVVPPTPVPIAPNDPQAASRLLMDKIRANRAASRSGPPS